MINKLLTLVLLGSLGALGGCESPTLIMTTQGLSDQVPKGPDNGYRGQYAVLDAAFEQAQARAVAQANSNGNASANSAADAAIYQTFALDGMAAVDGNCSDFFSNAGEHEKYVDFARDIVAAGGTLASGILALTNSSKDAVAIVSLSTGTSYSALDVYTKNFLFGADNIDSVRTLIMNALDAHQKTVVADGTPWDFNNAMRVILDHQEICRPSAIIGLVKSAIKNASLTAAQTGASQTQSPPPGAPAYNNATTPGTKHYSILVAPPQ